MHRVTHSPRQEVSTPSFPSWNCWSGSLGPGDVGVLAALKGPINWGQEWVGPLGFS